MSARGFGERMHEVLILAIKGLAGGGLVVAFALLSEGVAPKRFAGLFSAAPAAALAGLAVVPLDKGAHEAHENATGMIAGGAGMAAYAAAAVPVPRRRRASIAAALGLSAWFGVATLASLPLLLGWARHLQSRRFAITWTSALRSIRGRSPKYAHTTWRSDLLRVR